MGFWEKVKDDVQKSFSEGMTVIRKQTERITEEGKRKYRSFELKNRVHQLMAELGALVYKLNAGSKDPMADARVKALIERVRKLEEQLKKLEAPGKKKAAAKKKTVKKAAKKTTRKTAKKKTAQSGRREQ